MTPKQLTVRPRKPDAMTLLPESFFPDWSTGSRCVICPAAFQLTNKLVYP